MEILPLDFLFIYVRTIASIGTLLRLSFSKYQFLAALDRQTGRDYKKAYQSVAQVYHQGGFCIATCIWMGNLRVIYSVSKCTSAILSDSLYYQGTDAMYLHNSDAKAAAVSLQRSSKFSLGYFCIGIPSFVVLDCGQLLPLYQSSRDDWPKLGTRSLFHHP